MKLRKNPLSDRWDEALRKRRLSLRRRRRQREWHIHISPAAGIFAAFVSFALLLFLVLLVLTAYTPCSNSCPATARRAERSRDNLVRNVLRLDSMERAMNGKMMLYNEHTSPSSWEGKNYVWYAPWRRTTAPAWILRNFRGALARRLRCCARRWRATAPMR